MAEVTREGGEIDGAPRVTKDPRAPRQRRRPASQSTSSLWSTPSTCGNQLALSPQVTMSGTVDWRVPAPCSADLPRVADANYVRSSTSTR